MPESTQSLTFDEAIKAIIAGETVEVERDDLGTHPIWVPITAQAPIYRLRQLKNCRFRKVITTIDIGGFSVPKPLSKAPDEGLEIYIPTALNELFYFSTQWNGESWAHQRWLKLGMIHRTKDAAIAHAKALIATRGCAA